MCRSKNFGHFFAQKSGDWLICGSENLLSAIVVFVSRVNCIHSGQLVGCVWVSTCLWNLIILGHCGRVIGRTPREGGVVGWYNALIVNRRLNQCMVNVIVLSCRANSILHCLSARPSELSRSSLAINYTDSVSVTRQSGVSTYTRVLNFGRFFSLKVRGRLKHADRLIHGNIRYFRLLTF